MFLMNQPNKIFYIMNRNREVMYADLACLWQNNHVTITVITYNNQLNH